MSEHETDTLPFLSDDEMRVRDKHFLNPDGSVNVEDLGEDLANIVAGYPYDDPQIVFAWVARRLLADPLGPESAGLTLVLNYAVIYAEYGNNVTPEFTEFVTSALGEVVRALADRTCGHGSDEHPPPPVDAGDTEQGITTALRLCSPAGRAEHEDEYEDEDDGKPVDAWTCPVFVREATKQALAWSAS